MIGKIDRHISFIPRTAVASGTVSFTPNTDSFSKSYYQIPVAFSMGDSSKVKEGMSVDFGTTPGARDVGTLRVRKSGTAGVMLLVSEVAPSECPIVAGHYFAVRDEYLLCQVMPRLTGIINSKGYTTGFHEYNDFDMVYGNENKNIKPVINITYKPAGYVDEGQTYRTVSLSLTYKIMTRSATLASIAWDIGDGTLVDGDLDEADIVIQVPQTPYFRYIHVVVTDSSGASQIRHVPIWAHGENSPPLVSFDVVKDSTVFGRDMDFEFFASETSLTEDSFKGFSPLCYWETSDEEFPAGYRDIYMGFSSDAVHTLDYGKTKYKITTSGPEGVMRLRGGFAETVNNKTTPEEWYQLDHVTIERTINYHLRRYTTFLTLFNCFVYEGTDWTKAEIISQANLWEQISKLAQGYMCIAGCTSDGAMHVLVHMSYLETVDRAARNLLATIEPGNWVGPAIQISENYTESTSQVNMAGSYWSGGTESNQVYSKAPGLAPSYGAESEEGPYQRLPNVGGQAELNRRNGHHYARVNSAYSDVQITLVSNADIYEPALNEMVLLNWGEDTIEGWDLSYRQFTLKQVDVEHSSELGKPNKVIKLTLEGVTFGLPGQTYVPPKYPQDEDELVSQPPDNLFPGVNVPILTAPVAEFEWAPTTEVSMLEIAFNNTSAGDVIACHWDFGDSSESTEFEPVHSYATSGTYTVVLTVYGYYGLNDSVSHDLDIIIAEFDIDINPASPSETVTLTNESTGPVTDHDWDYGDSSTHDTTEDTTHAYTNPGDYNIELTESQQDGFTSKAVHSITIEGDPYVPEEGRGISISYTSSGHIYAYLTENRGKKSADGGPNYSRVDIGTMEQIDDVFIDDLSDGYHQLAGRVDVVLLGKTKIWRITDIFNDDGVRGFSSVLTLPDTRGSRQMAYKGGKAIVAIQPGGSSVLTHWVTSEDNLSTWSSETPPFSSSAGSLALVNQLPGVTISPGGVYFVTTPYTSGNFRLQQIQPGGSTYDWAKDAGNDTDAFSAGLGGNIVVLSNGDLIRGAYGGGFLSPQLPTLTRFHFDGDSPTIPTLTNAAPTISDGAYGTKTVGIPIGLRHALVQSEFDQDTLWLAGVYQQATSTTISGSNNRGLWRSSDGGDTWSNAYLSSSVTDLFPSDVTGLHVWVGLGYWNGLTLDSRVGDRGTLVGVGESFTRFIPV